MSCTIYEYLYIYVYKHGSIHTHIPCMYILGVPQRASLVPDQAEGLPVDLQRLALVFVSPQLASIVP